jgi:flagellar biosynthesis/type III secretory pathway ATPase
MGWLSAEAGWSATKGYGGGEGLGRLDQEAIQDLRILALVYELAREVPKRVEHDAGKDASRWTAFDFAVCRHPHGTWKARERDGGG